MNSKVFIILLLLVSVSIVLAAQPTQQSNKIFLSPFYRPSMTQNVQYQYVVNITTPDGISEVKSAIVTLDAWISPTRTFMASANGVNCTNPSYVVSTTYASAGRAVMTWDCKNAIIPNVQNTINISVSGGNIGASTAWLDLTYMNNPVGTVDVHGTEYSYGQNGKVWLQLLDGDGQYIDDGICYLHIYTPNNDEYIENAQMSNMNHDGIYYYDLNIPLEQGVYPAIANCFYTAAETKHYPSSIEVRRGTPVFTNLDSAFEIDANFFRYTENLPSPRNVDLNWSFTAANLSNCSVTPEVLMTGLNVFVYGTLDSVVNDDVTIYIYNWSSASWIALPNKILEGPGYKSVSNFLSTNNITESGYFNATNGLKLRTNDTSLTDGTNNNFDVDQIYVGCDELGSPQWQEIKGSSELHISSNKLYVIQFDSFSFIPEKINTYNFTVGSATSFTVEDSLIDVPIYYAYICGAIQNVSRKINGTYQIINWSYTKARETILDSCNLAIFQDLEKGVNYEYSIIFDDKWQEYSEARLSRASYLDEYIRAGCEFYRESYGYPAYEVPITLAANSSYGNQYSVCNYYFDTFYHLNKSVNENIINKFSVAPVTYTEEIEVKRVEADVLEIASLTEQLVVIADSIIQEWTVANSYSTTILGNSNVTPEVIQYWANISATWALYNYDGEVNYTLMADEVWSYEGNVSDNLLAQFAVIVWNYVGRYVHGIIY